MERMIRVGILVQLVQRIQEIKENSGMVKLRNLAMLYLIKTLQCDTWQEPCDDTLDRKHGMLYLIHHACSLPCHHAYVYFQFIHAMLSLPVFMLKVTRTYSVFMTDPFCFASFSSVSPPPGSQGGNTAQFGSYQAPRLFHVRLGFLLAMACFALLGNATVYFYASLFLSKTDILAMYLGIGS